MNQDSSRVEQILLAIPALSAVRTVDEPYMGHEFVSGAEVYVFYNAYAARVRFVMRVRRAYANFLVMDAYVNVPYNNVGGCICQCPWF
ncbi:hypothetical protein RYX36_022882 [Vicia faba]